jgi:CheY-like chemotaxis protein
MPSNALKPKVLVADDERVIAETLVMILEQSGFDARAVYSGEEALACAESFNPNMLISDVVMTGIDGIETAIRMRAQVPGLKVLLFSGQSATANLLENAREQGYEFDFLLKPVHPKDLLEKIRNIAVPVSRQSPAVMARTENLEIDLVP